MNPVGPRPAPASVGPAAPSASAEPPKTRLELPALPPARPVLALPPAPPSAPATIGRASPAVSGAIIGAGFPRILTPWGRDALFTGVRLDAAKSFLRRMERVEPREDRLEALHAVLEQVDHPAVKRNEGPLRAWARYLDLLTNPDRSRLFHFNVHEMPGVSDIPGFSHYAIRALSMVAGPGDRVVLPDDVPQWAVDRMQALRQSAGLPVGRVIAQSEYQARRAEADRDLDLQEFYRSPASPDRLGYQLQELFENKNRSMRYLEVCGVTVPELIYSGPAGRIDATALRARIPVVLKAVRSAGGAGVTLCRDLGTLDKALSKFAAHDEIQVQELIRGVDCSKQYYVADEGPAPISNTDQIIKDGVAHAGNLVTSRVMDAKDDLNADRAAWAVWAAGYRGYCAFDMVKPEDGGVARVIEGNLRMGGVTVPTTAGTLLGAAELVGKQLVLRDRDHLEALIDRFGLQAGRDAGVHVGAIIPLQDGRVKAEVICISPDGGRDVAAQVSRFAEG